MWATGGRLLGEQEREQYTYFMYDGTEEQESLSSRGQPTSATVSQADGPTFHYARMGSSMSICFLDVGWCLVIHLMSKCGKSWMLDRSTLACRLL